MGWPKQVRIMEGVSVDRHILRYVEEELRRLRPRAKWVESRKAELARQRPGGDENIGGGRPQGIPSDPTQAAVLRILQDDELQAVDRRVKQLEAALGLLPPNERQILEMLYLSRRYQMEGVIQELHISERSFYRLRNEALYSIAISLGIA